MAVGLKSAGAERNGGNGGAEDDHERQADAVRQELEEIERQNRATAAAESVGYTAITGPDQQSGSGGHPGGAFVERQYGDMDHMGG